MKVVFNVCLVVFMFGVFDSLLAQSVNQQQSVDDIMNAEAVFEIASWEEEPFAPVDVGDKLTRVSVVKSYSGDIEGEGRLEYLMRYRQDGSAEFYGLERVVGNIAGDSGSFVLRHSGTFEAGEMTQHSEVLHGSGTEELTGLRGEMELTAGHQQEYPFTLEYAID